MTLSVTQLARSCNLARSTVLYYEKIGLLKPPRRTAAHYRVYGEKDAERLRRDVERMRGDAERMRGDAERMRVDAERLRVELDAWQAFQRSRMFRAMQLYTAVYTIPVIGPALLRLRRLAGACARAIRRR